jgi:hypothetical protein
LNAEAAQCDGRTLKRYKKTVLSAAQAQNAPLKPKRWLKKKEGVFQTKRRPVFEPLLNIILH